MKRLFTSIFSLAAVMAALFASVDAQNRAAMAQAQRITGDNFTVSTRTPNGASIHAVRRPSAAMLNAIDRGLADLFNVARRNGYRRGLNHESFTIFVANPDRLKDAGGRYSPGIAVGAAQYAGTEYDQGGYIFAAGMVITNNPMAFVIAEHTSNFRQVSDLVRYEGEHLVLYHNDRPRYEETKDHSRGGGHPILR